MTKCIECTYIFNKLIYNRKVKYFSILIFFPIELIIGFLDTIYSVSEGDRFVLVKVGILSGHVANENVSIQFFTQDDSAIG